jgi:hypothetical protein
METKFKQAVYDTGKSLKELSREYAKQHHTTEESSYQTAVRYYNKGVKYYKPASINWAELLGKSFREIQEGGTVIDLDTRSIHEEA